MSRIEKTFKALNRKALITFIMAGDPDYPSSLEVLKSLPGAGADIIEIGMPFTDPVADGPVIQLAGQRALKSGANMKQTLQMVREFRAENDETPIVLMGYANPIHTYGYDAFITDAAEVGVDGFIIVDLPPEEDGEFRAKAKAQNLDVIRLITPTTTEARLKVLLEDVSGFLYFVSITGVTGAAKADPAALKASVDTIKKHTDLPVAIGFGIKNASDVAEMSKIADAVVVGSAIVANMSEKTSGSGLKSTVSEQVSALAGGLHKSVA